jgi:hypothetical protein
METPFLITKNTTRLGLKTATVIVMKIITCLSMGMLAVHRLAV